MSTGERINPWGNRLLNVALLALGVAVMALLYALVSQSFPSDGPRAAQPPANESSAAGARPAPPGDIIDDIIQVGVRNGCGEPGLAGEARGYLVRSGFDVVEVGNHSSFDLDSSLVIDRVGNRAAARRVARALGIPERRVRQDISPAYHLDASVILGSDYPTLKPFRGGQRAAR